MTETKTPKEIPQDLYDSFKRKTEYDPENVLAAAEFATLEILIKKGEIKVTP